VQNYPAIAIVEDDRLLREELACFFEANRYQVHEANCMEGLFDVLKGHSLDLAILDLNLPGQSGFEIAQQLRDRIPGIGIIMLTARTHIDDRVKGYMTGADIYLTKPTDPRELLAAVNRLANRDVGRTDLHWVLDVRQFELLNDQLDARIALTAVETAILRALALEPAGLMEVADLLGLLEEHFPDRANTRRSLENTISRLRKKVMDSVIHSQTKPLIKAHRNAGYQLTLTVQVVESN